MTSFAAWESRIFCISHGAHYLVADRLSARKQAQSRAVMFRQGLLTSLLNPKMAIFILALFSQFLKPEAGSIVIQVMIFASV
jgi:threonine/homoserine/homoserine lactone efflux protein